MSASKVVGPLVFDPTNAKVCLELKAKMIGTTIHSQINGCDAEWDY